MVIWLQLLSGGRSTARPRPAETMRPGLAGRRLHHVWQPRNPTQYSIADPVWLTAQPNRGPRRPGSGEPLQAFEYHPELFDVAFRPAHLVQPPLVNLLSPLGGVLTQSR